MVSEKKTKPFIACPILLEKKSLSQHGEQDREPSEHSEHRQAVERAHKNIILTKYQMSLNQQHSV